MAWLFANPAVDIPAATLATKIATSSLNPAFKQRESKTNRVSPAPILSTTLSEKAGAKIFFFG